MKYVHSYCLKTWRKTSSNHNSFFQVCLLRRDRVSATNADTSIIFEGRPLSMLFVFGNWIFLPIGLIRFTMHALTMVLLFLVAVFGGYIAKLVMYISGDKDASFPWMIDLAHMAVGFMAVGFGGFVSAVPIHGLTAFTIWSFRNSNVPFALTWILVQQQE